MSRFHWHWAFLSLIRRISLVRQVSYSQIRPAVSTKINLTAVIAAIASNTTAAGQVVLSSWRLPQSRWAPQIFPLIHHRPEGISYPRQAFCSPDFWAIWAIYQYGFLVYPSYHWKYSSVSFWVRELKVLLLRGQSGISRRICLR